MKWTPAMLSTPYLEANAINRWRGWNAAAATVSRVHGITVSGSAARQAYDRDCERVPSVTYQRKTPNAALSGNGKQEGNS